MFDKIKVVKTQTSEASLISRSISIVEKGRNLAINIENENENPKKLCCE